VDQREDSDYVYLDVPIEDIDETTVDTTIAHDHVTVSGTIEKKYDTGGGLSRSFFSRTLPLPEGVDQNQMAIVPQRGKVTLKFPKIKV
jgi:HSP20 family molecular chaperone IbpA